MTVYLLCRKAFIAVLYYKYLWLGMVISNWGNTLYRLQVLQIVVVPILRFYEILRDFNATLMCYLDFIGIN